MKYTKRYLLAIFFVTANAYAVDGGLEISQACVDEGCFTGDGPGFPITVTEPGIYFLTSNIEIADGRQTAISINASNVELNLNGFSVTGNNTCDTMGNCTITQVSGAGVFSASINVAVRNGFVGGFGDAGVWLNEASLIEDIQASNNRRKGLRAEEGSTIRNCVANNNGDIGIEVAEARVIDSTAIRNGQFGFAVGRGSILDRVIARENLIGITDSNGATIMNSSIFRNRQTGLEVIRGGTQIFNSQFLENDGVGIGHRGDSADTPGGIPAVVRDSVFYGNSGSFDGANFGGAGPIIGAGTNLCNTNTTCNF